MKKTLSFIADKLNLKYHLIKVITYLLFFFFILFFFLCIATRKSGISSLTKQYIDDVTISDTYFENYTDAGFSENNCREFLQSDTIKDMLANVMAERIYSIFDYDAEYSYTYDECYEVTYDVLSDFVADNNISLSGTKLETLTSYTLDITGATTMLNYDTPAAYKTAVFEADAEEFQTIDESLDLISALLKPKYPVICLIIYLIFVALLFISDKKGKDNLFLSVADTAIIPSLAVLVMSIIGLIGNDAVLSSYIFKYLIVTGVCGLLLGILCAFVLRIIQKETKKTNE